MNKRYFYCSDGVNVTGPFAADELRDGLARGVYSTSASVCEEGADVWYGITAALPPVAKSGKSMLSQFVADEQDPGAVEKIIGKVSDLLTKDESISYIAVQKKPIVNISPAAVVVTTTRLIIVRPSLLGMTFEDFLWTHVNDVHMSEQLLGATITAVIGPKKVEVDCLPKKQARRVYAHAQEIEQRMLVVRRGHAIEEMRARSGGTTFQMPPPMPHTPAPVQQAVPATDPHASLLALKQMLDSGLISQAEYDAKKSELLSRL